MGRRICGPWRLLRLACTVLQPATATWKRFLRGLKGTLYSASKKLVCQITIRFITIATTKRRQWFLISSCWISCTADHNPRMIGVTQKMLRVVLDRQAFQLVSLGETSSFRYKTFTRTQSYFFFSFARSKHRKM